MMFADPPYNVTIERHVLGLGAIKHGNFAMASGELSAAEFLAFLKTFLAMRPAARSMVPFISCAWIGATRKR